MQTEMTKSQTELGEASSAMRGLHAGLSGASIHYRKDIDGLRAIAVLAVIAFHVGWLQFGYLGVDVFFVLSGYLITGICLREAQAGTFRVMGFWMRRVRRILPLVCVIVAVSLVAGALTMLPDDLENLAQSVIATNIFANNVLQAITTRNYWDVVNEYKPLMHTWSLGVEEQYYVLYPVLVPILVKRSVKLFQGVLGVLAIASLFMFLADPSGYQRFFYLPYRFFELAAGGLLAVWAGGRRISLPGLVPLVALAALLTVELGISVVARQMLVIVATLCLLSSDDSRGRWHVAVLTNPVCVFIGLMSFSLYMWHQVVFAFARYFVVPDLRQWGSVLGVLATCFLLSYTTWRFIERPFRDPRVFTSSVVVVFVLLLSAASSAGAAIIYLRAGVIRNVPELDVNTGSTRRGMHAAYNHRIYDYNRAFSHAQNIKILVIGNSFARDWANVLLESPHSDSIELSYVPGINEDVISRAQQAALIYVHADAAGIAEFPLPRNRTWFIGTKSFGTSNGIAYNASRSQAYCRQRARPEKRFVDWNKDMRSAAGERYIDFLSYVTDSNGEVPVFTPDCRFVSQDTRHLTRFGAKWFSELMATDLEAQMAFATSPRE